RQKFTVPLDIHGTKFQMKVWQQLIQIPYGATISYQRLAENIGDTKAVRAVGKANGSNPVSIIIPCHRVINSNGKLGGYSGGLDVKEKQSGTSVKGKPCISKKGNKNLRKAMHLPALSAIRNDERFKAIFARIVSKHGIKMKAAVAVQRKLLEMVYTIYKTGVAYDKDYLKKQNENIEDEKIATL
ncbi:MAG: methylated-DNA--[protein]-cysteine S-methyltransferase, partial [Bacteroidota bacterium]|nr:methylated-DNA--[protein]-cysteine S-methyltransferase [Bacteroidota bacterium]